MPKAKVNNLMGMRLESETAVRVTETQADKIAAVFRSCLPLAHAELFSQRNGMALPDTASEKYFDTQVAERAGRMANNILARIKEAQ